MCTRGGRKQSQRNRERERERERERVQKKNTRDPTATTATTTTTPTPNVGAATIVRGSFPSHAARDGRPANFNFCLCLHPAALFPPPRPSSALLLQVRGGITTSLRVDDDSPSAEGVVFTSEERPAGARQNRRPRTTGPGFLFPRFILFCFVEFFFPNSAHVTPTCLRP